MNNQLFDSFIPLFNNFSNYENNTLNQENQLNLRDIFFCNGGDGGLSAGTANTLCIRNRNKKNTNVNNVYLDRNWSYTQEIYVGSITVVGLFLLFRLLQKSF